MPSIFRNTLVFVVGYVILMIPTYLLPWLGSNSAVLNAVGAAIGHGMTPQWWAHAWCLVMLVLMTWMRGDFVGKKYFPVLTFLAAVFDLTPGLSMIPLVPTALHLAAIILGVKGAEQQLISDDAVMSSGWGSTSRKAGVLAGLMTVAAIFGSVLFVGTSKKNLSEYAEQKSGVPIKNLSPESPMPLPTAAKSASAKAVPESAKVTGVTRKAEALPTIQTDSRKQPVSPVVKRKLVQKKESNDQPKVAGNKVRYINLNE